LIFGISIIHYNEDTDKKFDAAERLSTMRNGGFEGYIVLFVVFSGDYPKNSFNWMAPS
jgi:hypothetical protein